MSPRADSGYEQGRHVRISREVGELMDRIREKTEQTYKVIVERALEKHAKELGVK